MEMMTSTTVNFYLYLMARMSPYLALLSGGCPRTISAPLNGGIFVLGAMDGIVAAPALLPLVDWPLKHPALSTWG